MPGTIESTAFLSQLEDMDKYLLEYRSLKLMPQVTNTFGAMRLHNNNFEMNNDLLTNGKKLNNVNGNNNANNNGHNNNRKRFMNKQAFRLNSPTAAKFTPHTKNIASGGVLTSTTTPSTTPLINSHHFSKSSATYPLYYNTTNSSSAASLVQAPLSSSTSSHSFVPAAGSDSSLSGYDPAFDYVMPAATDFTGQFNTPFSKYLNSGINSNVNPSAGGADMINTLGKTTTTSFHTPLTFNQPLPTSSVSASIGASGLPPQTTADLSSNNLGNDQLLMNDLSLGWGSNHVSSTNAGSYGIWNNDMSVWS